MKPEPRSRVARVVGCQAVPLDALHLTAQYGLVLRRPPDLPGPSVSSRSWGGGFLGIRDSSLLSSFHGCLRDRLHTESTSARWMPLFVSSLSCPSRWERSARE